MDHLVMGVGQHEMLGEGVHHGEGEPVVVEAAEIGVQAHVIDGVMHEAHIPLEAEAQAAIFHRAGDQGEGGGFLGDGHGAGVVGQNGGVHLLQEGHRVQIDVAAVLVGGEVAAPSIVQVQHGGHGVHPDAVHMVLLKEQAGGGDQEALHLVGGIVEDQGAPVGMLGHALLLALKLVGAVEAGQAVLVLGEVGGYPVNDHADAGGVKGVHHALEVVRVAVAGGGGVVAGNLIAPGPVIGVLGHRHQLHMGVAHVLAVGSQGLTHQPVLGFFIAHVLPGAQMHLVNAHGLAEMLALFPLFHIGLVRPLVAAAVPDDGSGLLPVLGEGGKGVGLQHLLAVPAGDAIFIKRVFLEALNKADPGAAFHQLHGCGFPVPAVKVAHQGHGPGVGRPYDKTVGVQFGYVVAAIAEPGLLCLADVKKVYVPRGDEVQVFGIHAHISLICMYFVRWTDFQMYILYILSLSIPREKFTLCTK